MVGHLARAIAGDPEKWSLFLDRADAAAALADFAGAARRRDQLLDCLGGAPGLPGVPLAEPARLPDGG
ncbi:hypothetical protein BJY16_008094 [Actinoplanes octamycinicus]|uniref:Uncharacterized protein n=1 Tax=Actinoplanes octamycinicus TaxID=135948 RepID=A0A7W7H5Z0_9ACTN|nr:hypothetical protein [Actinoplanes octamycinicus]MBB4744635.1 hypothetical protein [Actinoplanes octamycinicus]GIE55217.1 hypothetical protein Aoc01nite_06190 [Actinoplanes octamycinicus]